MGKKRSPTADDKHSPLAAPRARTAEATLRSYTVGAIPILNKVLKRMRLEEHLKAYLPAEDGRTRPSTPKTLLILVRNLLLCREPLYGMGEWAARHAPDLLGVSAEEVKRLNDDRMGRCLDRLFLADVPSLALAVATQVVREFDVSLDELHNDSTSITFSGAYVHAGGHQRFLGRPTLAITWGHNKDHRPDLKQLLFILTVTEDGGVPIHFRAADGNTTDVTTHRDTWEMLCQLAGRRDFLYVADCKLVSTDNLRYIDQHHGRFLSVLPRNRSENIAFRGELRKREVPWEQLFDKTDQFDQVVDRYSFCTRPSITAEGFRLVWYHSTLKEEQDAAFRGRQIQRALRRLEELRRRLRLPRTRYRQIAKVRKAVADILDETSTAEWITFEIIPKTTATYHAQKRGRPNANSIYCRKTKTRFDLQYEVNLARVAACSKEDGVFPLVTNVAGLSPKELLMAYKRQPVIEKRFSQLKTDFSVAPVYLKEVRRVQGLLCAYFFALMVEALLERELRRAMHREEIESLPMYPEGRPCRRPTACRLIDVFSVVQRHEFALRGGQAEVMVTELTRLQRRLLRLLGIPAASYGR